MTDAELIAILIHSGSRTESAVDLSRRILNDMNNDLNILSKKSIQELIKYKGIGEAKAIGIAAAMELVNRKNLKRWHSEKLPEVKMFMRKCSHSYLAMCRKNSGFSI